MNSLGILRAFVGRDWESARSYRLAFAFQFVGIFSELVLYYFLGRIVDESALGSDAVGDQGFFAFVVVGRTLLALVSHSVMAFSQSVQQEQATGSLEALMMTPQNPALLIAGSSTYASITVVIIQMLTIVVAVLLFGLRFDTSFANAAGAFATIVACVVFFAAVGLAVAGGTLVVKRGVSQIAGYGISAIALLSGVYYPVDVLPQPLQFLASLVPFTWAVELLRDALYADDFSVGRLGLLVVAAAGALPVGLWIFRAGLNRAKHEGTLAQY